MMLAAENADERLLDLLRLHGPLGITDLVREMKVTATAVRQRLHRLMGLGMISRDVDRTARGRPGHRYRLTDKAATQLGTNFVDLTMALWSEVRAIRDPQVRAGLLERLAKAMAKMYEGQVVGEGVGERMASIARLFSERKVPFAVENQNGLPVLTALACPYPVLAEQDRAICSVEKMLFSQLLGEKVRLSECRLNGDSNCCRFEAQSPQVIVADSCY